MHIKPTLNPFAGLPKSNYKVLFADPPWRTVTWAGEGRTPTAKRFARDPAGDRADHYPTMSLDELCALPVSEIAADDAVLAMWIISTHLDQALILAEAWGFSFATDLFYWAKSRLIDADQIDLFTGDIAEPRISMGKYTRKQVEPCWLFKRGRGVKVLDHGVRQLICAPPREHSRKPVEQYDRLEKLFGDVPRVELFSRTPRQGWDAWGNETGKFQETSS